MIISEDAKTFITDKLDKLIDDTKRMSIAFMIGIEYCTTENWKNVVGTLYDIRNQLGLITDIACRFDQISSTLSVIEGLVTTEKETNNEQT